MLLDLRKKLFGVLLMLCVSVLPLSAKDDHNLTDAQLYAVMGIITSFILSSENPKELALKKIKAYAGSDGNTSVPSIQDYTKAQVVGVDSRTLTAMNDTIASMDATEADSTAKIQQILDTILSLPPVLTLNGDANMTVELGSSYVEQGATALDALDGNLTSAIVITGTVDSNSVGTYIVFYNAIDGSGNIATEVTRTVNVVDTIAPTTPTLSADIPSETIDNNITVEVNGEVGAKVYVNGLAVATVGEDGKVKVTLLLNSGDNSFSITLRDEFNNQSDAVSFSVLSPISINLNSTTFGEFNFSEDRDFFKITITQPGELSIYTSGGIDTYGQLFDSNGVEISHNDDTEGEFNFMISKYLSEGVYFVKVRHINTIGNYSLHTDFVNDDHGNSFDTATKVALNSSVSGNIEFGLDFDIFKIEPTKSGKLIVLISDDTYLYLLDSSFSVIFNGYNIYKNISKGNYYIVATNVFRPNGTGSYALDISFDDHGNTIDEATNIDTNISVLGEFEKEGDFDFFKIDVTQSGELTVNSSGNKDTFGYLLDADGNEIISDDDSGEVRNFSFSVNLQKGIYFIKIRPYYNSDTGSYSLNVSFNKDDANEECDPILNLLCSGHMDSNCNCVEQ